jgi:integrase
VNGTRRRKRKKFREATRGEVQRKRTAALNQQQTGGIVPLQKGSFGDYLVGWLEKLESKRAAKTMESYRWIINHHIKPELGTNPLTKLTQVDLNAFMKRKLDAGQSPRTVRYCHAIIRSALTRAEKDGLVGRNVAKLADPPAKSDAHVEPLTADGARRLLMGVSGDRLEALYSVAPAIGLRRGEALGMTWAALNLEKGFMSVTQTVQRIKGKGLVIRKAAKNKKGLRTIPLPTFAVVALEQHRCNQAEERAFAGDDWEDNGLVFCTPLGKPLDPRNLVRHFHGVLKLLGMDQKRFHDLRHTAASLLLAQGATLHDVKEILGHSQISLTADLYGSGTTDVLRQTVDLVGSMLAPQIPVAPFTRRSRPN